MATLSTASGYPYPATSETPDVQRDLKALVDYLEAHTVWTAYTPVLTGFTPGNGVASGKYQILGKTCRFWAKFVFGTTSAAAAAYPVLTLPPVTAATNTTYPNIRGTFLKNGVNFNGAVTETTGTTVKVAILGTSGLAGILSTTTPFTWATNDAIHVAGEFEMA